MRHVKIAGGGGGGGGGGGYSSNCTVMMGQMCTST